jgi:bifunctional non-homologous end joining protein LigD
MPTLPAGFIAPCLPTKADRRPSDSEWLHEIKHDGFRVIARKNAAQVKLYSRPGNDLTYRFPLIVETLARLRSRDHTCSVQQVRLAGRLSRDGLIASHGADDICGAASLGSIRV